MSSRRSLLVTGKIILALLCAALLYRVFCLPTTFNWIEEVDAQLESLPSEPGAPLAGCLDTLLRWQSAGKWDELSDKIAGARRITTASSTAKQLEGLARALGKRRLVYSEWRLLHLALREDSLLRPALGEAYLLSSVRLLEISSLLLRFDINLARLRALQYLDLSRHDKKLRSSPCFKECLQSGYLAALLLKDQRAQGLFQPWLDPAGAERRADHQRAAGELWKAPAGRPAAVDSAGCSYLAYSLEGLESPADPSLDLTGRVLGSWRHACGSAQGTQNQVEFSHPWKYLFLQEIILESVRRWAAELPTGGAADFPREVLRHQLTGGKLRYRGSDKLARAWTFAFNNRDNESPGDLPLSGELRDALAGLRRNQPSDRLRERGVSSLVDEVLGEDAYLDTPVPEWCFTLVRRRLRSGTDDEIQNLYDLVGKPTLKEAEDAVLYLNFVEYQACIGSYDVAADHLLGIDVPGVRQIVVALTAAREDRLAIQQRSREEINHEWKDLATAPFNHAYSRSLVH